jgi:hypothetical protein
VNAEEIGLMHGTRAILLTVAVVFASAALAAEGRLAMTPWAQTPTAKRLDSLLKTVREGDVHGRRYAGQALMRLGTPVLKQVQDGMMDAAAPLASRTVLSEVIIRLGESHASYRQTLKDATTKAPAGGSHLHVHRPAVRVFYAVKSPASRLKIGVAGTPYLPEEPATTVRAYAPSGKLAAEIKLGDGGLSFGDGQKLEIPADGEAGVYRVEVRGPDTASWQVNADGGPLALDAAPLLGLGRSSGGPFYFKVPRDCESFAFTVEALDPGRYAVAVLAPGGKIAADSAFESKRSAATWYAPGCPQTTVRVKPPAALRDKVWSVVVQNADDAVLRVSGLSPVLSLTPAVIDVPAAARKPRE